MLRTHAAQARCLVQIMVTISATPIASMGISIQGMGAASLADWMRTRDKLLVTDV